jgi:hypothetical protein
MFTRRAVWLGMLFALGHVGLCIASWMAWDRMYPFLAIIDLPLTFVAGPLAWAFGLPLLPFHFVLGTVLWFFVPVVLLWIRAELARARANLEGSSRS